VRFREHFQTVFGQGERDFRWRGGETSRLEGLTDGVFALALTLIVVTLDVPRTSDEVIEAFVQLPVFGVCFMLLFLAWHAHFQFHRRYGLEDALTVFLNGVLLFLILAYVYPLKFIFSMIYNHQMLRRPWVVHDSTGSPLLVDGTTVPIMETVQTGQTMMILYSVGFAGIFAVFTLMTWNAWRMRDCLEFDERERLITRGTMSSHAIQVAFGLASVALASLGARWVGASGMIYFLIGPAQGILWSRVGRRVRAARPKEG
jgi:hypothetical protein